MRMNDFKQRIGIFSIADRNNCLCIGNRHLQRRADAERDHLLVMLLRKIKPECWQETPASPKEFAGAQNLC